MAFWFAFVPCLGLDLLMPTSTDTRSGADPALLSAEWGDCLVAAPEALEEACFSVPAVRALIGLSSALSVLCPESQQELWESVLGEDAVYVYPDGARARQLRSLLDGHGFGCAILWEAGEAARAIAKVGVKRRVGYPAKGLEKHLSQKVERVVDPGPIEHRVRFYLGLAEALGAEAMVRANFEKAPLAEPPGSLRIALARRSGWGESYDWGDERFSQVQAEMEVKHGPINWLELEASDRGLLSSLAGCHALLASDGEVAHWAAHLGLPAVVVFGPGEPAWKRPLGKQSRVVRQHVACSPCFLSQCPLDLRCQKAVTVERVVEQLDAALAER